MSASILKAMPGKLDIKRHSPSILYISATSRCQKAFAKTCLVNLISKDTHLVSFLFVSARLVMSTNVLKALPGELDIKTHSFSILYISASLAMSTSVLKALPSILYIWASHTMSTSILEALPGKLDINRHSPGILYVLLLMCGVTLSRCNVLVCGPCH